jgi:hypothetical protein
MPAMAVVQPNGLYARFSSVVDDFTHTNQTWSELWDIFQKEGGNDCADGKLERAGKEPGRFAECLEDIERVHGKKRAEKARTVCSTKVKNKGTGKIFITGQRVGLTDLQRQIVEGALTQPVITAAMMLDMIEKMKIAGTDLNTAVWDNDAMTFVKVR